MKKISIACLLFFYSISSMGQSLDDINTMMGKQQFKEAQVAIDKFLADPKNVAKADGWYYKGRIYNSLSYDKATPREEAYDLKMKAFEAFQKNQQLDAKDLRLKVEGYKSYLDIYYGLFDLGANFYNEKVFDKAYSSFTNALQVKDFILEKKYDFPDSKLYPLDTALVLNAAISAMQSKNDSGAVMYYKKLTDANVSGESYQDVYEYLADYYSKKGDAANFQAIVQKGKTYYPASEFWVSLEMENIGKNVDPSQLFAKYDEMMVQNPTNFVIPYNYSIELFNSIYGRDAKPADADAAKAKLTNTLKAAIANDKGKDATVLMTKHLYNLSSDLSIAASLVKGTKPEDVKKKADLVAQTKTQMDQFIDYAKIAVTYYESLPTLKPVQKATYQELLTNMSEIYNYKKDAKSAAEIDKKKAAL
ncbi:MAG: hypothetical protein H7X88_09710 [Gloeobacteraceae cyanobacterium ES-bin-316]|nr:hypothetical protein [Ferruginibacter sp.]